MRHWKISSIWVSVLIGLYGASAEAYFSIGTGFDADVYEVTTQTDGDVLVGGAFAALNASTTIPDRLLRLNNNGTIDTAFAANLGEGFSGASGNVRSIVVQDDDKILVGGYFATLDGGGTPDRLIRLNSDGTVDTTFSTNLGSGFDAYVEVVALQDDGKILVGGNFTSLNGSTTVPDRIIRLNTDGTVDTTFSSNIGTGVDAAVETITLQADNKILVGGEFTSANGSTTDPDYLIRYNSDGTLDTTFSVNLGTGFDSGIRSVVVQDDEKILVGGGFGILNGSTTVPDKIVRLNASGTIDTAFSSTIGSGFDTSVQKIGLQSDGKIVVVGNFTSLSGDAGVPNYILRLSALGAIDTTFSGNLGDSANGDIYALALDTDDKILIGGSFTSFNNNAVTSDYLLRLNSDGTLDPDAPPTITILGSNPASLTAGDSYSDAGATATDISDGTVTDDIVTTSNVNTATAGSYRVVYTVTDSNLSVGQATRTVTVSSASSGGSSSGGGGGGGGGNTCKKAVLKPAELKTLAQSLATTPDLKKGDTAPAVKTLQQFLNGIGCTITKKGDTSFKNETTEFTSRTTTALKKFQKLYTIKPADGTLNKATRTYIQNTYAQGTTIGTTDKAALLQKLLAQIAILQADLAKLKGTPLPKTTTPTTNVTALATILVTAPDMTLDTIHPTVKTLQQFLNTLGYTLATNDFGAPGRETTTFWYSAQNALKRFQKDHNVPETGVFDQATREVIRVRYTK